MAKQAILSALEDIIGEYIVNVDKENLKIQALRGQIKLDNVQLDGDLLGGYILGPMGLSGFGILSCWAKTVKITVPYKNIEKEPTRIEIKGCHLLCLPLLPSTANRMFGTGNSSDPRCTLRTRAKRSKLARFEKNFMNGRIAGEGPTAKSILWAVRAIKKEQERKKKKNNAENPEAESSEAFLDYLVKDLVGDTESDNSTIIDSSANGEDEESFELPINWRAKLREKILRNLEVSFHNVHLRCEVSEGGLDFYHPDAFKPFQNESKNDNDLKYDQRAFAFGVTCRRFIARTANQKWEVGSHETKKTTTEKNHLGPNPYDVRNNKVISWEEVSMYWDDDPPLLISETDIIQSSDHKMSTEKFHLKIANAMIALYDQQEPGQKIRESLGFKRRSISLRLTRDSLRECPHQYCFKDFQFQVRMKISDRTKAGPISCHLEFISFQWDWKIRPFQFVQYQKLRSAMLSQRRFDTMLRQRPGQTPLENPREWWKYAFDCVTTRPNSRPWNDVLRIAKSREQYLKLVTKKLECDAKKSGFHAGLTEKESRQLLALEDFLPIEALMAFHLVALRQYIADVEESKASEGNRGRGKAKLSGMFRNRSKSTGHRNESSNSVLTPPPSKDSANADTILEAMKIRFGQKQWRNHLAFVEPRIVITFLSASDVEILQLVCEGRGAFQRLGPGKQDYYFDISKFEALDCQGSTEIDDKIMFVQALADLDSHCDLPPDTSMSSEPAIQGIRSATNFMDLPPSGVVCRFAASKDQVSRKLSFSAHPATLIWKRSCFDALAEFFGAPSTEMKTELSRHLSNVSTPLARKAQLAFLSQTNFQFHINVAAPKIWVPFSPRVSDGSLLLDAGNFRMACIKGNGKANMEWNLNASDIQINYARWQLSEVREKLTSATIASRIQKMIPIIRPFQVHVVSGLKDLKDDAGASTTSVDTDISISPICVNLVDAEVLARAIGKWYSQGILAVRGRTSSARNRQENEINDPLSTASRRGGKIQRSLRHSVSFKIEKVEMALEGHSKTIISDGTSVEAHLHTRRYVVEVFQITAKRSHFGNKTQTEIIVADASIVQLRDSSDYVPMMERHEAVESQYCVLESRRAKSNIGNAGASFTPIHDGISPTGFQSGAEVLKVSLFHDGIVHLNEVEIDVDSVILRVTPISLKDCTKGIKKIVELVQLMTREMERKVHEEGRKARRRDAIGILSSIDGQTTNRPVSPTFSIASDLTDPQKPEETYSKSPSDSSLLFKVTIRDGTLLAGRPTSKQNSGNISRFHQSYSFAVVHIMSNALIMFQSIENPDASGNKTLHMSLDSLSASVITSFDDIETNTSPMIGPTGAEFRAMNATENLGCIVSHDISLDCEHLKTSLTPNDLSILISIVRTMMERLGGEPDSDLSPNHTRGKVSNPNNALLNLLKYQKQGTGIATNIRVEFQTFSFVVLREFQSKYGAPEFLAFHLKELKGKLGGCISALSGECTAEIAVSFYNSEVGAWEYAVESFPITLDVDQMPNELILDAITPKPVQLNLTGIFLRDCAELDFQSFRRKEEKNRARHALTPSALSTVGLRRATESHVVIIKNFSGMDIDINYSGSQKEGKTISSVKFESIGPGIIKNSCSVSIDSIFDDSTLYNRPEKAAASAKLSMKLAPSSVEIVGQREAIVDLPVLSTDDNSASIYMLKPIQRDTSPASGSSDHFQQEEARSLNDSLYDAEPVVEWCMQNQRLRSGTMDLYSLDKGRDLLSAGMWSPEEDYNVDALNMIHATKESKGEIARGSESPSRRSKSVGLRKSEWLRPYLTNDSPEWTDMTCILSMARERVVLPDVNWIWANDWSVDVSGDFGESTDADGWEYQADFETFTRTRRFYQRGDCCRRRRWTRTRVVKPPRFDDPLRPLKLVWQTSRDEKGNFIVEVKSHVVVHNLTASSLTLFASSPSWGEEYLVGSVESKKELNVPIALASAFYLRLAKKRSKYSVSSCVKDFAASNKFMILPTSYNSNAWRRTSIQLGDVSGRILHFLVKIVSNKGIVDIFVEPVLKVINLLPCQLECQLGEVIKPFEPRQPDKRPALSGGKIRIANVDTLSIASGKEGKCNAVNPASKPHISLRVPGYKWSGWQRIVNRKADSHTWQPNEVEEEWFFDWNKADVDNADEFKMMVRFDRHGVTSDPLFLILAVECGHSPTIRVYSQYWVVDKTGFGCHFCESFSDLMGSVPDSECSRRSHLLKEDARNPSIKRDMGIQGHQWTIGMSGMTLYFSRREKIALRIESGTGDRIYSKATTNSKWTLPMDISNVMPKTVFSVDERGGPRCFELAISVSVCPGIFSRTRVITLIPRYQIVNLLKRKIVVGQNGCLKSPILIPSQSSVPFHREKHSLPPKARLGAPSSEENDSFEFSNCWSNGCIQLDRVGITSMRLPTPGLSPAKPMVVQAEVRLATKEQSCAVVIVLWTANEQSNPLYLLRNSTPYTIICRQPLQDEESAGAKEQRMITASEQEGNRFECGAEISPIVRSMFGLDRLEEYVWVLHKDNIACFGFDDPEKPHILEWALTDRNKPYFDSTSTKGFVEIDAMGSSNKLLSDSGDEFIVCQIRAEQSTKVIEFTNHTALSPRSQSSPRRQMDHASTIDISDEEDASFSFRLEISTLCVSFIDNVDPARYGREILMAQFENLYASFSQSREGYHEMELRLLNLQVDNHVPSSIHPVLVFCPRLHEQEPFLHLSAVRRLQNQSFTYVFRYAAFRMLEVNVFLDRRTAEFISRFIEPIRGTKNKNSDESPHWVSNLTLGMEKRYSAPDRRAPFEIEEMTQRANSGRIYFEQLHLHPVRIALTFSQEWTELNAGTETIMIFQFIRGMASIADAPLTFTSFVVAHVFESPHTLARVIATHYSSQLTKQIFAILGSLAILGAPADFISNVGTGVRDFFYEPIQGAVQGPRQFIEGLEAGTQSLARGVFVGVVRGAANVTEVVNSNLAGLTADDDFIDERKARQRILTDAMSRGITQKTFYDSLYLAGSSIMRGVKSGATGIVDQPTKYASKFGPVGFMKGVGKAVVGAVVKPVVGVGDAATLLMNHVSDATSRKQVFHRIPKRLRRALPSTNSLKPNCVSLKPYDDRSAKAQKIVTGGESVDDVYIGHVNIATHLIIASEQCLWAIDRNSREPWCVSWEEISHYDVSETGGLQIAVFSQSGLMSYFFQTEDDQEYNDLKRLLSMQLHKTGNAASNLAELRRSSSIESFDIFIANIPGIKVQQTRHVFGSCNRTRKPLASTVKDEIDVIEQCFERVKNLGSDSSNFLKKMDEEAWSLVSSWGQVFSGLSSRRCIAASIINGTGGDIQIKSTKLVEGGSPCYSLPTREFDPDQGVLHAGGVILFFGWGTVPNLLQQGHVFMHIETNGFIADLADQKSPDTNAEATSGYQIGFLEKSYDDAGWWAKYWLILLRDK